MTATLARRARIKVSGAAVAFTDEACTNTGDNQTYRITDATKRVWDRSATITVEEAGAPTAESYAIDRLAGTITFASADAGRGAVTVSGQYLPLTVTADCRSFTFSASAQNGDESTLEDADTVRSQLSADVSGSIGRFYLNGTFRSALIAGAPVVLELAVDSGSTPIARAWAVFPKVDIGGARDGYVEESIDFEGSADADGRSFTFL